MANGNGHNGHLPPRQTRRRRETPPPPPPPIPSHEPAPQLPITTFEPPASRQFRDLQDTIRLDLWDFAQRTQYNPWQAIITMAEYVEPELAFQCHKEVAQYLLPKLKAIEIQGTLEHHHSSEPLQVLFAKWEQEEAAERDRLPPWTPPGIEALDMRRGGDETWDLDEETEDDDDDAPV